ncbi:MAG: lipoate--protein ligase family protein [Bacteroidales bacterium]|nr:lipoate--protein ligase family protein [Bacteroidales bacterium]
MNHYILLSPFRNPFENVALEYYLVHHRNEKIILLYINSSSVIIGKHQNAYAEANFDFLQKHQIPLARRISGGGTVYHDEGNLNISLIMNAQRLHLTELLNPISEFLSTLGLNPYVNYKNDIIVENKKITGTAAHIFKHRILQHATLLLCANQNNLKQALQVDRKKFEGNFVASNPSATTNVLDVIRQKISLTEILKQITDFFKQWFSAKTMNLTENEISKIKQLSLEKFSTWEWNFAYSPSFIYSDVCNGYSIQVYVNKGIIEQCIVSPPSTNEVFRKLIHKKFQMPFSKLIQEQI